MHETPAVTADMVVLPGVLGSRTLRCTEQVRLRSSPAVPRDGCPVARPSPPTLRLPRGRGGLRRKAHAEPLPSFAHRKAPRAFHLSPADRPGLALHYRCCDYAALQSRPPPPWSRDGVSCIMRARITGCFHAGVLASLGHAATGVRAVSGSLRRRAHSEVRQGPPR